MTRLALRKVSMLCPVVCLFIPVWCMAAAVDGDGEEEGEEEEREVNRG